MGVAQRLIAVVLLLVWTGIAVSLTLGFVFSRLAAQRDRDVSDVRLRHVSASMPIIS